MSQKPAAADHPKPASADTFRHDTRTILTTMRLQTQLLLRLVRQQRNPDRDRLLSGLTGIDAGITKLAERIENDGR